MYNAVPQGLPRRSAALATVMVLILTFAVAPSTYGSSRGGGERSANMPDPVAFDEGQAIIGASTVRIRGRQMLYRIDTAAGKITRKRRVDFGRASVQSGNEHPQTFGARKYIKLTGGRYRGWWVAAPKTAPSSVTRLGKAAAVRIKGGDRAGVRFYANGTVKTVRAVHLTSAATFAASRRGSFNGRTFYFVTEGAFANRWVSARTATLVRAQGSTPSSPLPDPSPEPVSTAATWKIAVLIYSETDVTFVRSNGSEYRLRTKMTATMRDLAGQVLRQYRNSVGNWSGGLAAVDMDIIDVPHALTSVNKFGGGYWVGPDSVSADLDRYAPPGEYDSVIVLWDSKDADGVEVPVAAWGLSMAPGWWANGAGYSSIIVPTHMSWWTDSAAPEEVFVHEWLHQVIYFQENAGRMRLDLHAAAQYGYTAKNGSYKVWYSDVMRGLVRDGGGYLGLSRQIWAAGTPSDP